MPSDSGKSVILKGGEKSGIIDGIKMGSSELPSLDPFNEFDSLGKDQDEYDLMTALSIMKTDWGRESHHYPEMKLNVFDLFDNEDEDNYA